MLVRAEERAVGRVDRRLYRTYLAAWGPFFAIPIAMLTMAMSERGLQVSQHTAVLVLVLRCACVVLACVVLAVAGLGCGCAVLGCAVTVLCCVCD